MNSPEGMIPRKKNDTFQEAPKTAEDRSNPNSAYRKNLRRAIFGAIAGAVAYTASPPESHARTHGSLEEVSAREIAQSQRNTKNLIRLWQHGERQLFMDPALKEMREDLESQDQIRNEEGRAEFDGFYPKLEEIENKWQAFFLFMQQTAMSLDLGTSTHMLPAHDGSVEAQNLQNSEIEKGRLLLKQLDGLALFLDSISIPRPPAEDPAEEATLPPKVVDALRLGSDANVRGTLLHYEALMDAFVALPEWAQREAALEKAREMHDVLMQMPIFQLADPENTRLL